MSLGILFSFFFVSSIYLLQYGTHENHVYRHLDIFNVYLQSHMFHSNEARFLFV